MSFAAAWRHRANICRYRARPSGFSVSLQRFARRHGYGQDVCNSRKGIGRADFFLHAEADIGPLARPKVEWAKAMVPVSIQVNHPPKGYPVSERSGAIVRTLAMLSHARRSRKRPRALVEDRTLQTLVADFVAARTAAAMTQHEVAMRMWTTKSAVSRLESGCYARSLASCGARPTCPQVRRATAGRRAW